MDVEEDFSLSWDDPLVADFQTWSQMREEVDNLTSQLNHIRDRCMSALETRGYRDHKGSQFLSLPFSVGPKGYGSLKRERRVSTKIDEEVAEIICRSAGVYEDCFPAVRTLDPEQLYVEYQKGVLTQEDMDNIFTPVESYSFRPMS